MTNNTHRSSLADELSKLKTELIGEFCSIKDEIIDLKEVIIQNLYDKCRRLKNAVSELRSRIVDLETKYN